MKVDKVNSNDGNHMEGLELLTLLPPQSQEISRCKGGHTIRSLRAAIGSKPSSRAARFSSCRPSTIHGISMLEARIVSISMLMPESIPRRRGIIACAGKPH